MKRVCESMHFNEEVPSDVWSYIINIYHHLKFTEQWQELKLACLRSQSYLLPVETVEIPLYEGDRTDLNTYSLFYKIHSLCWNTQVSIVGVCVDSFDFAVDQPSVGLDFGSGPKFTVFNYSMAPSIDFIDITYPWSIVSVHDHEDERLVGHLTIPLSAFPQHLFHQ